ncbi:hypothetical protein P280DRAFT_517238 [Massarina eburnea CBS 473.64]|uniref:Uncharacterized protein n=1 Tax=Massarina eburnea CBS 473.64 TaxID=1395130 RepID=A0A6A6S0A0_9PLEO|nr:hypothetical protein P280DRAFT_517238 [Massarina eburnea CBS 473.64]
MFDAKRICTIQRIVFFTSFLLLVIFVTIFSQNPPTFSQETTPTTSDTERSYPQQFHGFISDDPSGWASRPLSKQGGFLITQYNETYKVAYGVSMFHALHCVEMLRVMITPEEEEGHMMHLASGIESQVGDTRRHLVHCLDYIIQVLKCGGDATIEPPTLTLDDEGNILKQEVTADGSVHICKNTDSLYDLATKSEVMPLPWFEARSGDTVEDLFGQLLHSA